MCCCCPPAISALFCLWVQSGFSKGTVAGALTFFPPEPPLYKFERFDKNGRPIPDDNEIEEEPESNNNNNRSNENNDRGVRLRKNATEEDELADIESPPGRGGIEPVEPRELTEEKMKSPAQQLTERAKNLRRRAKRRNSRDARDVLNGVQYRLVLDPRLSAASAATSSDDASVEALKLPSTKGAHIATVIYRVPADRATERTKTIIYSHGNATDLGAMFPLQAILVHSLDCNVVMYDYSGYGESGGISLEANTYQDLITVYDYTLKHVANNDASNVVLYGQSVGSGPCCYLACRDQNLGGMILHSPFTSGMRVLTPSRALACLDIYPNINRIKKAKCPVMVIHGRLDEEVDIAHGVAMHQAVPRHLRREPWWVPDRGHNDITEGPGKLAEYLHRIREFCDGLDE